MSYDHMSAFQQELTPSQILYGLQKSGRFSNDVLAYLKREVILKSGSYFENGNYNRFWAEFSKKLRNVISYKRGRRRGVWDLWEMLELKELLQWSLDMSKPRKKDSEKPSKLLDTSMDWKFYQFLVGDLKYLIKLMKRGLNLSKKSQIHIKNQICAELEDDSSIIDIITKIDLHTESFNSIVLKRDSIVIINHFGEINIKKHAKQSAALLNITENADILSSKDIVNLGDILTGLPPDELEIIVTHIIRIGSIFNIRFHQIDDLGNRSTGDLSKSALKKIRRIMHHYSDIRILKNVDIRQLFTEIFLEDRTFVFTSDSSGFVKQVYAYFEKLNLWINIEKTLASGGAVDDVRESIRYSFREMTTLKHSSNNNQILSVDINDWINCLKQVSSDEYGKLLIFNFEELKDSITSLIGHGKKSFLDRFDPRMSNEHENVPDRWNGIIYDKLGNKNYTNMYIFRVRDNISDKKRLLEKKIVERLEESAERSLKELNTIFNRNPILEALWKKYGNQTYRELLQTVANVKHDPLQILKSIEVKFEVVSGEGIIRSKYDEFIRSGSDLKAFKKAFNNKTLIKTACKVKPIFSKSIKPSKNNNAYEYLSSETKNELSMPRYSKRSQSFVYTEITNEIYNSAAIRVFFDLITKSDEGKDLLCNLGIIKQKSQEILKANKSKLGFIIDFKTGTSCSKLESQTCGVIDGIVTTVQGSGYLDEFIIEMIGNAKGNYRNVNLINHGSPFNSVIADMLRVACYYAAGIPGMVVYGHFRKKGNFIYTIIVFNKEETVDKLRYEGANMAVDMSRPRVRNLLQDGHRAIMDQLQKVFKIPSDLDLGPNLLKFSLDSATNDELFGLFLKLIKIILEK
ncbi:MAG: hypothetical protein ACFFC6_12105 [Promethearchaeota archaeon]